MFGLPYRAILRHGSFLRNEEVVHIVSGGRLAHVVRRRGHCRVDGSPEFGAEKVIPVIYSDTRQQLCVFIRLAEAYGIRSSTSSAFSVVLQGLHRISGLCCGCRLKLRLWPMSACQVSL
jgi:hypothetical protein